MCNINKHNNIIQYVNIENMGDREGIYFRLIHYIQYTFNKSIQNVNGSVLISLRFYCYLPDILMSY
jgi:hypothetical protein